MHRARFFDFKVRSLQRDTQGAPDNQAWETEDPANEWVAERSSELSPWARGSFWGGGGAAGAQEVSVEGLTDRLSRSNRGRCGVPPGYPVSSARAAGPGVCTIACSGVSTVLWGRAPRLHSLATQATPARVSSSAGRRPSMRRSEGEAKCGHKACAV